MSVFVPGTLRVTARFDLRTAAEPSLIVDAALIYALLGYLGGYGLMAGPLFGVAPCPTTLFTIGVLLLMMRAGFGPRLAELTGVQAEIEDK